MGTLRLSRPSAGTLASLGGGVVLTLLMVYGVCSYWSSTGPGMAVIPWGVMVVGYVFFALLSGGIFDAAVARAVLLGDESAWRSLRRTTFSAIAVLVPGILLVFADLLHPWKAYWLYLGFNWESRIAWNAILYLLYAAGTLATLVYLVRLGETRAKASGRFRGLALATVAVSLMLEANLGMAYGVNVAVPGWYGPEAAILFVLAAFTLGAGWTALVSRLVYGAPRRGHPREMVITGALLAAAVFWYMIGLYSWPFAQDIVSMMTTGAVGAFFWASTLLVLAGIALAGLAGKGRLQPLAGLLLVAGVALFLLVPFNYAPQAFRSEANPYYEALAHHTGWAIGELESPIEYLATSETLAFIGAFGLWLLIQYAGNSLLALEPGERPRRLLILK